MCFAWIRCWNCGRVRETGFIGGRRVNMEMREVVSFGRGLGSFGQVVAEDGANVPYYHRPPRTAL